MDSVVSRLESGRAILEDPPHVDFPGIFVGKCAAQKGTREVGDARMLGKGKLSGKPSVYLFIHLH
jgi:hypothetical protein